MSKKQGKPVVGAPTKYPHFKDIFQRLWDRLDREQGAGMTSARAGAIKRNVTRLANLAGTRRLKSHARTFERAVKALEKMYARRDHSADREAGQRVASLAYLLEIEGEQPQLDAPEAYRPGGVRVKGYRRVAINVIVFERYGIQRWDKAIVAIGGEVGSGKLGYFEVHHNDNVGRATTNLFAFACRRDAACAEWTKDDPGDLCLRSEVDKCRGYHKGEAYGPVVAVERGRRPVETALDLTPDAKPGAKRDRFAEKAAQIVCYTKDFDAEYLRSLGLRRGESFRVIPRPDPKPRQIVIIVSKEPGGGWEAGRFVCFEPCDEGVPGVTLDTPDDGVWQFELNEFDLFGIGEILPPKHPHATRIAELRQKLERLDESDSALAITKQFELEEEIYRLENETGEAEEWPEVIVV